VSVKVTINTVNPLNIKVLRLSDSYLSHYEHGKDNVGDQVSIVESRPISKLKRWSLEKVVKAGVSGYEAVSENVEK
ncbi:MAG: 30S ribosomal protein S17, partial [Chloroflexota bacterium]|nr:30S ribosomal protein S17 [Chloroflexota bacterium]